MTSSTGLIESFQLYMPCPHCRTQDQEPTRTRHAILSLQILPAKDAGINLLTAKSQGIFENTLTLAAEMACEACGATSLHSFHDPTGKLSHSNSGLQGEVLNPAEIGLINSTIRHPNGVKKA